MNEQPRNPDCPVCSPLAVAGRRCADTHRFLDGGAPYWRLLWQEHVDEIRPD